MFSERLSWHHLSLFSRIDIFVARSETEALMLMMKTIACELSYTEIYFKISFSMSLHTGMI